MNYQAVTTILLGIIVAKLYPSIEGYCLIALCLYIALLALKAMVLHAHRRIGKYLGSFSSLGAFNYALGLIFCVVVLFSSVALPLSLAEISKMPYGVGHISAIVCLAIASFILWRRLTRA